MAESKNRDSIIFLGRLEKDTGLLEFLAWIAKNNKYKVAFIGDGSLRKLCEEVGKVQGFIDPTDFLKRAWICVPGGYLSYIEGKLAGCRIITFSSNKLKTDYWREIGKVNKFPKWINIADEYLDLYNSIK